MFLLLLKLDCPTITPKSASFRAASRCLSEQEPTRKPDFENIAHAFLDLWIDTSLQIIWPDCYLIRVDSGMERQEGNVDAVWKFIRKQERVVVWVKFSSWSNRNMCSNVQI